MRHPRLSGRNVFAASSNDTPGLLPARLHVCPIDDGQDALVAGRPASVQNSYAPSAERSNSVTDQRNRLVFSWIYEPRALDGGRGWIGKLTKNWKNPGVVTAGSGRPLNATVIGDANQDDNSSNDRLPARAGIRSWGRTTPPQICGFRGGFM